MRYRSVALAAYVVLLGVFSSAARACCGPQDEMACFPGFGVFGPHIVIVLPLLAGLIQQPFLAWAGAGRDSLWLAVAGNFLNAVVMSVLGLFALMSPWMEAPAVFAWFGFVIAASAGIEFLWLRRRVTLKPPLISFGLLLAANLVSAVVIGALPFIRAEVFPITNSSHYLRTIESIKPFVIIAMLIACGVTYVKAFRRSHSPDTSPMPQRRGFEVLLRRA